MTTEHRRLRTALDVLSAYPPPVDGIAAAATGRARRMRRRRVALASGASTATAVAVALGLVFGGGPTAPSRLVGASEPTLPPLPVPTSWLPVPLPIDSPTPKPTPTKPSPKPTPTDSVSPSPTDSPKPDNQPLKVTVTADVKKTETATLVNFTYTVHRDPNMVMHLVIDYADGRTDDNWKSIGFCPPASPDEPADFTFTTSHAFRAAGTYAVTLTVEELTDCNAATPSDSAHDSVHIDVDQGAVTSNGPYLPLVYAKGLVGSTEKGDGLLTPKTWTVRVKGSVFDDDGWLTKVTIDWGDGSTPEVKAYGTEACVDSPTMYPQSRQALSLEHAYSAQKGYQVIVTVVTTGCDGNDPQEGKATPYVKA